jgi:hypothetical protein
MITNKRPQKTKIEIDLLGPEGNAFALLGIAKDLCHKTGIEWEPVKNEMTSSDYEWLLQVMDHYFGDFIIMYR